ncbi:MAG: TIGR03643 family protein [Pseudomonadota bacterium]
MTAQDNAKIDAAGGEQTTFETSELIALAWADDASFDAIEAATGLAEKDVIALMRRELKPASFRAWRKRVSGRATKHAKRQRQSRSSQSRSGQSRESQSR